LPRVERKGHLRPSMPRGGTILGTTERTDQVDERGGGARKTSRRRGSTSRCQSVGEALGVAALSTATRLFGRRRAETIANNLSATDYTSASTPRDDRNGGVDSFTPRRVAQPRHGRRGCGADNAGSRSDRHSRRPRRSTEPRGSRSLSRIAAPARESATRQARTLDRRSQRRVRLTPNRGSARRSLAGEAREPISSVIVGFVRRRRRRARARARGPAHRVETRGTVLRARPARRRPDAPRPVCSDRF